MRRTILSLLLLLTWGSFSSVVYSQAWIELPSGTTQPLNSISFCDSVTGYAVGDNGTILRTTNGGTTWIAQSNGTADIMRKVVTVTPGSAFIIVNEALNGRSYVIYTSDSGHTWNSRLKYMFYYRHGLSFVNTQYGVALSSDDFYRTTDGGDTWQTLPTPYSYLSDISFSDPRHGMACGVYGSIYVTSDSGYTWTHTWPGPTYHFSHILLVDSLHAVVTGQNEAFVTSDGGTTWQQSFDRDNYKAISALDKNHIALISEHSLARTTDGGATWITSYGSSLEAVEYLDTERMIVTISSGLMLRSLHTSAPIPSVTLSSPTNGEANISLADTGPQSTLVILGWHKYDLRDLDGFVFDFEFREDSALWTGGFNARSTLPTESDTVTNYQLSDSTKYFWRMRPIFRNLPPGSFPWSEIWSFTTPELRKISVRSIQEIPLATLLKLDTVQADDHVGGASSRQTSLLRNHWASITVKCVVPPGIVSPSIPTMFVCDTAASDSGWHGILVSPFPGSAIPPEFMQVNAGDVLHIIGRVTEVLSPVPTANSMTVFYARTLSIAQHSSPDHRAIPVPVSKIFRGAHPFQSALYSTGEQYEGMYIELHNLTVVGTASNDDGSFTVADDSGNTILTGDASRWFTLRGHRDSLSLFSPPVLGSRLDTLRGMLWTIGNTDVPANDWGFRIVPIFPEDIHYAPTQNGMIEGIVFNDDNRNQVCDPGEAVEPGWKIDLGGDSRSLTLSNAAGAFRFMGLGAGAYTVRAPENQHVPFQVSSPPNRTDSVTIAPHESYSSNFGVYFPWDWIEGKVFYDVNENGVREPNEPPVVHAFMRLRGPVEDSTWTDSLGRYEFHHVLEGENTVSTIQESPWEVIPLTSRDGVSYTFYNLGQLRSNFDFMVHRIPARTRIHVTVHDNTEYLRAELWWGVRPGATDGIGGADGHASNFDISEGESEVPPRSFAQFLGLFDARFIDPGTTTGYFGYGSWSDMRNYFSPGQVNTYLIAVLPGYSSGGDYPITLSWSRDSVRSNYAGAVTLTDEHGTIFDMKQTDSVVVTDPTVEYVTVSASRPNLSHRFAIQWHLISLPMTPGSSTTKVIFPTASSNAFSFNPAASYVREDTVASGPGYWLKFSRGLDTFPRLGSPRLTDTLTLSPGWNLIGTLSEPVDARSVVTSPPALVGNFFTYDGRYIIADSLHPEYGYWVKAKQAGTLILSAGAPVQIAKERSATDPSHANVLTVTDAEGNAERLTFGISGVDDEELPPIPPEGVYDARFATNRRGEMVGENETKVVGLKVSSGSYPLKISWELKGNCTTTLVAGGKRVPLRSDGSIEVASQGENLALEFTGSPDVPRKFSLEQNYPNPFNPSTVIRYNLPARQAANLSYKVSLRVYNLLGQVVATLVDGVEETGYKSVEWNGNNVASGMYFYRIEATAGGGGGKTFSAVRKMILIK